MRARVAAYQRAYDLSRQPFDQGVDGYLSVLDSQRSLFSAQQVLVETRLLGLNNLVFLYRVLGGGWTATTPVNEPLDASSFTSTGVTD